MPVKHEHIFVLSKNGVHIFYEIFLQCKSSNHFLSPQILLLKNKIVKKSIFIVNNFTILILKTSSHLEKTSSFLNISSSRNNRIELTLDYKLIIIASNLLYRICEHSIFSIINSKICLMGHWTFRFLLILVGNINCSIGLFKSENLIIFKFRNSKFDLKDNFVNN